MRGERFPIKLHRILEDAETRGFEDIIGWCPGGKSFVVRNKLLLERDVMSYYFTSDKFKSFQRSLNLWGFQKRKKKSPLTMEELGARSHHIIRTEGEEEGYCHPLFIRGKVELCDHMLRERIKHPGTRNHLKEIASAVLDKSSNERHNVVTAMTTNEEKDLASMAPPVPRPLDPSHHCSLQQKMEQEGHQLSKVQHTKNQDTTITAIIPPPATCSSSVMSKDNRPGMSTLFESSKGDDSNSIIMTIQSQIKSSLQGCAFVPSPPLPPPPTMVEGGGGALLQQLIQNFPDNTYLFNDQRPLPLATVNHHANYIQGSSFFFGYPHVIGGILAGGGGRPSGRGSTCTALSSSSHERELNHLVLQGLMTRLLSHYTKEQGARSIGG